MDKEFKVKILESAINHPFNIKHEYNKFLTKKEFWDLKKKAKKDNKNNYHFTILSDQEEPLLFEEKLKNQLNKIKKNFLIKKSIKQMQNENIKREYIHKKYFWLILIITAIISALIGKFLG
ncbi:MAG: hypothetical protein RAP70_01460 [Candidatus Celaenobacter antarcticus]|nr:hypothetical protein [Candidatus Celaenobacter antarcticus]